MFNDLKKLVSFSPILDLFLQLIDVFNLIPSILSLVQQVLDRQEGPHPLQEVLGLAARWQRTFVRNSDVTGSSLLLLLLLQLVADANDFRVVSVGLTAFDEDSRLAGLGRLARDDVLAAFEEGFELVGRQIRSLEEMFNLGLQL